MVRPVSRTQGGTAHGMLYADNFGTDIITNAGVPVDGTSGTGAGFAGPASLCLDRTNGKAYINTGTRASPVWIVLGTQS